MSEEKNIKDYRDTLLLPKTDLPMKAKLSENEPKLLDNWDKIDTYRDYHFTLPGQYTTSLLRGPGYCGHPK